MTKLVAKFSYQGISGHDLQAARPDMSPQAPIQTACAVVCRSYKGSNIALMIELLAGPLVGGAVQDKGGSKNWGNLMVALDPAILGDPQQTLQDVHVMLGRVKGARRADGGQEVMLPGERGNRLAGGGWAVSSP